MLKLMYITNDPTVAKIAADAGVDRIFIDMEVLGKAERQGGMDTVQSHHTPEDIAKVRAAIGDQAEIMARVNPMNSNSQTEIDDAIANGADVIMLPMWRTVDDLRQLLRMVNGRAKVMPLLETDTAAMREIYAKRRALVLRRLHAMGLCCPVPEGAFYAFPDIRAFGFRSEEFCLRLIAEAGVAAVPGSCFGTEGHIRISYCCGEQTLERGMDRLEAFLEKLKQESRS